jgi:hypothetical protein
MMNSDDRNQHLSRQLEAYAVTAQANRGRWQERLGSWPAYAAAVGSGLALASAADAAIIYSGPENITVAATAPGTPGGTMHSGVLLKIAPGHSLEIGALARHFVQGGGLASAGLFSDRQGGGVFTTNRGLGPIHEFPKGASIGGTLQSSAAAVVAFSAPNGFRATLGSFVGPTGYAGFKLANGDLGWIRLKGTTSFGPPDVSLTALGWAYNDVAGAPITAGETAAPASPVPEPSSLALALMAAGSAGVLAWRKRRQATVSQS